MLVTGFSAVRLPRSAFSVSTMVSVSGSITELGRALRERLDAQARGNAEAWGRYVDDPCLCGPSVRYRVTDVTAIGAQRVGVALMKAQTVFEVTGSHAPSLRCRMYGHDLVAARIERAPPRQPR
ncbi:MAG: hypothetical protein ABIT71_07805 [Vicinamibacteraceae bacterium]